MNPWAFLIIGIGVLLVIMGVKGSYPNIESALTGKPHGAAQSTASSLTAPLPTVVSKPPSTPSGKKPARLL